MEVLIAMEREASVCGSFALAIVAVCLYWSDGIRFGGSPGVVGGALDVRPGGNWDLGERGGVWNYYEMGGGSVRSIGRAASPRHTRAMRPPLAR